MARERSLREIKYVAAQMNKHNALLEEGIFAIRENRHFYDEHDRAR